MPVCPIFMGYRTSRLWSLIALLVLHVPDVSVIRELEPWRGYSVDEISKQAIDSLTAIVTAILPPGVNQANIMLIPKKVACIGIGGVVGISSNPSGEIIGRNVEANVDITVKANDENTLRSQLAEVASAFMTKSRKEMVEQGLSRLEITEPGASINITGGFQSSVSLTVQYEYLKTPTDSSGIIKEIPLNMDLGLQDKQAPVAPAEPQPAAQTTTIIDTALGAGSLIKFEVIDDLQITQYGPSKWQENIAGSSIDQTSSIKGGGLTLSVKKAGTYLLLRTSADIPVVQNFHLTTRMQSNETDGIGAVFRWKDADNFYFFLASQRHKYHFIGKKVGGVFAFLQTPAAQSGQGYTTGVAFNLRVEAEGNLFKAFMDDVLVVEGEDNSIAEAGRVGFMCHGNSKAHFQNIKLVQTG